MLCQCNSVIYYQIIYHQMLVSCILDKADEIWEN